MRVILILLLVLSAFSYSVAESTGFEPPPPACDWFMQGALAPLLGKTINVNGTDYIFDERICNDSLTEAEEGKKFYEALPIYKRL